MWVFPPNRETPKETPKSPPETPAKHPADTQQTPKSEDGGETAEGQQGQGEGKKEQSPRMSWEEKLMAFNIP